MTKMAAIGSFQGKNAFLSMFFGPVPFLFNGRVWRRGENAFQAAKTFDEKWIERIQAAPEGRDAKRLGRLCPLRSDWERVKLEVMLEVNRAKFGLVDKVADRELMQFMLDSTGDCELLEGNTWGDDYWGVVKGQGQNHLGKILMRVREEMRNGRGVFARQKAS